MSRDRFPLLGQHRRLLALSGVDEQLQRSAGLRSHGTGEPDSNHPGDLPSGILLPVSDGDGVAATVRLFPDRDPLGVQPIDLGRFDREAIPYLDVDRDVRLVPTPFIAFPLIRRSGAVLVCTHDLCALALAGRTGLAAVSTFGEHLLERAVGMAAELAAGEAVILALYFGPSISHAAVRRAVAIAGVLGREVRIATWGGRLIDVVPRSPLPSTRPAKPGGLWGTRALVALGPLTLLKCEGFGAVAAEMVGGLVTAGMRVLVRGTSRRPLPTQSITTFQADLLRIAAEIQGLASSRGAAAAVLGGFAIDVVIGRQVRPRKDIDIAVAGGPPDTLEYLADALVARGFELLYRRSRSQAVLRRGQTLVDLYRLIEGRDGALHLATRTSFVRLSAREWFVERSPDGVPLRVLAPALLYQMKLYKATIAGNLLLRSHWQNASPDRADFAALGSVAGLAGGIRRSRRGEFQLVRILPFAFRPLPGVSWWGRPAGGSVPATRPPLAEGYGDRPGEGRP
jgi:hypothetical protein